MRETQARKAEHIRICLEEDVQFQGVTNGLERYRFTHCCLPELNRSEIDLTTTFLGKSLGAPLLISSMTGGTEEARVINFRLAEIAQQYKLAMGVGSQRVVVENPQVADTFAVRSLAPDILLFANLGAVQLNYSYGRDECLRVLDLLEADALILHLNPLQECIQPQGDTNFRGLIDKIGNLCAELLVPVIVKEVGNGICAPMAEKLIQAGVAAIDVAGAGGTSWAKVESERALTQKQRRLGLTFADWGVPTAECITQIRAIAPEIPLIASGGCVMVWMLPKRSRLVLILLAWPGPSYKQRLSQPPPLTLWSSYYLLKSQPLSFARVMLPFLNSSAPLPCKS